jgi:hypothetical protein
MLMAGISTLCGLGFASSLSPTVERFTTIGLLAIAAIAVLIGAVRRELRIRRRLAAIQPLPEQDRAEAI